MRYALSIHYKPDYYEVLSEAEQQAVVGEYVALARDPRVRFSGQLQPVETATTVRVQDGRPVLADGPFSDSAEVFGAFFVFEVDRLDDAIELAARVPAARLGGAVEIRPVVQR